MICYDFEPIKLKNNKVPKLKVDFLQASFYFVFLHQ